MDLYNGLRAMKAGSAMTSTFLFQLVGAYCHGFDFAYCEFETATWDFGSTQLKLVPRKWSWESEAGRLLLTVLLIERLLVYKTVIARGIYDAPDSAEMILNVFFFFFTFCSFQKARIHQEK